MEISKLGVGTGRILATEEVQVSVSGLLPGGDYLGKAGAVRYCGMVMAPLMKGDLIVVTRPAVRENGAWRRFSLGAVKTKHRGVG